MAGTQTTYDDDEAMQQLRNGQLLVEYGDDYCWCLGDCHRKISSKLRTRLFDQGRLEEVGRFNNRRHYRLRST